jgi:hypothetical protein
VKTRLILKPGQKGSKRLTEKYGDSLICIRYRYDDVKRKRLKTVELIEETCDWIPPPPKFAPNDLVSLRIAASNMYLREQVKKAGGRWVPNKKLWYVKYGSIVGSLLENHIHIDEPVNKVK